ncbi:hypothetical protein D3C87_1875020 [compost metagenome]
MSTLEGVHRLGNLALSHVLKLAQLFNQTLNAFASQRPGRQAAAEHVDQPSQDCVDVLDSLDGVARPIQLSKPRFDIAAHMARQAIQNAPHGLALTQHVEHVFQRIAKARYQGDQR